MTTYTFHDWQGRSYSALAATEAMAANTLFDAMPYIGALAGSRVFQRAECAA